MDSVRTVVNTVVNWLSPPDKPAGEETPPGAPFDSRLVVVVGRPDQVCHACHEIDLSIKTANRGAADLYESKQPQALGQAQQFSASPSGFGGNAPGMPGWATGAMGMGFDRM